MCEVKGGCTCGNEYCQDDFDVSSLAPKVQITDLADRKVYTNDVQILSTVEAKTYIDEIRAAHVM